MRLITIEVFYETMRVKESKLTGSRIMWVAPGLEVYVKGSLPGIKYEQAANLAMNVAEGMHIPASSLRRVGGTPYKLSRGSDTKSKRMF
jgi:hypothetical protein